MVTDTSERGFERRACTLLAGDPCEPSGAETVGEPPLIHGGAGWMAGSYHDYDREYCVDLFQLTGFLRDTQPETAKALELGRDDSARRNFLVRLQREITKRGTIDVLRHGIKHGPHDVNLFYATPSPGNEEAQRLFKKNRFTVTRQLRYSQSEANRALDVALFINGLPVFTFELKNRLTRQTVDDAVQQYRRDRDPREPLFRFGRCVAHFAVDENEVRFCTHLKGKDSWFLPFNQGCDDGAGNPPNPNGLKTDYFWKEVLARRSVADIIENYVQVVRIKHEKTGRKQENQIWPRYHQLDVVRRLLADVREHGAGRCYLIQHSAGSGKSNSIAWLAHRLVGLEKDGEGRPVFDSIIVVTDRRILDGQIRDTIRQHAQVQATVGHAEASKDLRQLIESGKKIIISTVQKFPFILEEIGDEQRGRRFAIIIDEAHSSQGGRTSAAMSRALSEQGEGSAGSGDGESEDDTTEDKINRLMESRKLLPNASYFAFTATPKNRTLEIFGEPDPQPDGAKKYRAFHSYTMKQAIQERFILDVLANYTPVKSYYKLVKTIKDDPKFDANKARKKLVRFVEGNRHAIRQKAEVMVDHFHEHVLARRKIGGEARAMVVTNGVDRAIRYFHEIRSYLEERKSSHKALVAFSGERKDAGATVSEASLNGFPSAQIAERFREDPYRFLVCADKFQTGYDEPLLHTMYVDKTLSGIKAVQTLSRLNRAHSKKDDVFVLDFLNDAETIQKAFEPFYRTTILSGETDPDRLHDLQADLDGAQVYSESDVESFVRSFLAGTGREKLDPILDRCVEVYVHDLDEDQQVDFKGKAKGFLRSYAFLGQVLPYTNAGWEKRSIFLNFLVPKLPAPQEEDLSRGILEVIDMDSYRLEKQSVRRIMLAEGESEIDPVPMPSGGRRPETEQEFLSIIIGEFNERSANIAWKDTDRVQRLVTETIPSMVAADPAYQNARRNSDEQNARIEGEKALRRVMNSVMQDDMELFKQYTDDDDFKRWFVGAVLKIVSQQDSTAGPQSA